MIKETKGKDGKSKDEIKFYNSQAETFLKEGGSSQKGEKLLSEAESIFRELANLFERNIPNLVVRRSQEVVEISLKALLKAPPSFYFEKDYTLEEAKKAKNDALGVLDFAKKLTQRIKG